MPATTVKHRYVTLDALRGVAALIVIWYHVFEGFASGPRDQGFNHGYLAVDFFFMLSGFVIGYAYDDRLRDGRMTAWGFFKRRLVRLHPMVIVGVAAGVVAYVAGGCQNWDGDKVSLGMVAIACVLNLFMLPMLPGAGADVRGNGEMFPLNGPHWSLFFEYIGNALYVLIIRRLKTTVLWAVTGVAAVALTWFAVGNLSGDYHLGVGWTLAGNNLWGGMLRLMFSFTAGLLMSRYIAGRELKPIRWAMGWCSLALIGLLTVPFVGSASSPWINGVYESVVVIIVFPVILYIGASARGNGNGVSRFLGDISYPVYAIHYPLMYLFYQWVWTEHLSFGQAWPVAVTIFAGSILLAWALLRWYDQPVRHRLSRRL